MSLGSSCLSFAGKGKKMHLSVLLIFFIDISLFSMLTLMYGHYFDQMLKNDSEHNVYMYVMICFIEVIWRERLPPLLNF